MIEDMAKGGDFVPSNYAHYRFGIALLAAVPPQSRRAVARFRRLYDVGLHGPDPFFYYNPVFSTRTGALGEKYHAQTGLEFFGRVCRSIRLEPSEGAIAYLYGVLCHYCLDSVCHPYIDRAQADKLASHVEIEAEFDRYLLACDGKTAPHTYSCAQHLHLTPGEAATAARFYPGASRQSFQKSVKNMAFCVRALATPEGSRRRAMRKALSVVPHAADMLMTERPNPRCAQLDTELAALYARAAAQYPEMAQQIQENLHSGTPLGPLFAPPFG